MAALPEVVDLGGRLVQEAVGHLLLQACDVPLLPVAEVRAFYFVKPYTPEVGRGRQDRSRAQGLSEPPPRGRGRRRHRTTPDQHGLGEGAPEQRGAK